MRSVTHLPEQQSLCHLQVSPPSRHSGLAVGAETGDAVGATVGDSVSVDAVSTLSAGEGAAVSRQIFPVEDTPDSSGPHLPEQHDAPHRHSTPRAKHPSAGTGADVALQLLPVLDDSSVLQMPLQQSVCQRHSSFPSRHCCVGGGALTGAGVVSPGPGKQDFPVDDDASTPQLYEQHCDRNVHSCPVARHNGFRVGTISGVVALKHRIVASSPRLSHSNPGQHWMSFLVKHEYKTNVL